MLHHPAYRAKYEINLKREFPRLPFYEDFRQWAAWGRTLMELHLGYEQAAPFPLARHDRKEPVSKQAELLPGERLRPARLLDEKPKLKPKLKADKAAGTIEIDATTTLHGIPAAAWDYKLGNRSGLEWVLDQWKEHKISDPTVAAKFNTYRFADHKEAVNRPARPRLHGERGNDADRAGDAVAFSRAPAGAHGLWGRVPGVVARWTRSTPG